ncbi:MAG: inositol monophosphatase family protein [Candidatus Pelagibacter sp.]
MNTISANLNIMIKACEKASKTLIRDFGEVENLQVSMKGPSDFVTNADKKVEKILIEELLKAKKNFSILSEETGFIKNKDEKNIWIIDPIDGTTNFLHGIPHFSICIALKSHKEIISGLIFDPIKDEMFYAEKNLGSFLNNKRIRVSKKKDLKDCLFGTNGKKYKDIKLTNRKSGSAALDMAYVASGRYDGFFQESLNLWDIASGVIIISEAGGIINKADIEKINDIEVITSSSNINEKMLNILDKF